MRKMIKLNEVIGQTGKTNMNMDFQTGDNGKSIKYSRSDKIIW